MSDVEVSRPLIDIEVDIEYPELTTNSMILGRDVKSPYYYPEEEEVSDNWKGNRDKCKEAAWKRWVHEYLSALREMHNLSHKKT